MAQLTTISSNLARVFLCTTRRSIFTSSQLLIGKDGIEKNLGMGLLNAAKSEATDENDLVEEEFVDIDPEEERIRLAKIEKIRNKSRLRDQHRNVVHGKIPYPQNLEEPVNWAHETLKYKRMMYGKYGEASGVDPRICFYTQKELKVKQEYERVAYPYTLAEMVKMNEQKRNEERDAIFAREEKIAKNLQKLDQWKSDLQNKITKKETDARKAKERKERLVEEVRRHFGFTVDARDEKFKELLEQKEKEDKKMQKEAKRKAKEDKMLAKLVEDKPTTAKEEST